MSNISYSEVYAARKNKHGNNHKQREYNYGILDFEKYLAQHPSSVTVDINGVQTLSSILSNRQDQFKLTKQILTKNGTNIKPGSIVTWDNQKWIVYQRVKQPNQTYITCYMVRCNNKVSWIDNYGIENQQYCYIMGAQDSKIKANYRTWNGMITPQPNQYLQILVPFTSNIPLGQKFIINKRAWKVIESDDISAPGIVYYSLTEDKIDRLDDDVEAGIINYKMKNKVEIKISNLVIEKDKTIAFYPMIYDEGKLIEEQLKYQVANSSVASVSINLGQPYVTGLSVGSTKLKIYLSNAPQVYKQIFVTVQQGASGLVCVFEGDEQIRISQTKYYSIYQMGQEKNIVPIINYQLSNSLVSATIVNNKIRLTANQQNKIGTVVLKVYAANKQYTKTIKVRSLW